MFRPVGINELKTPALLFTPTTEKYNGVRTKVYPENGDLIFVNFKTKGGTETVVDGVYRVIDTAEITTWWNPNIKSDSRIEIDSNIYEVKSVENIEGQNMFMIVKLEKVSGGV
jgi:hypothetical protein